MSDFSDLIFIFGAKYLYLLIIAISFIWFLNQPRSRQKEILILACVCLPLAIIIFEIASRLYHHVQPFVSGNSRFLIHHKIGNSFPSHHMLVASFLPAVIFIFDRRYSLILWALAFFVGFSRVYAGLHYITDIAGSLLIAVVSVALGYFFVGFLKKNSKLRIFKEK